MKNKNIFQSRLKLWIVSVLLAGFILTSGAEAGVSDHTLQDVIFIQNLMSYGDHWYSEFQTAYLPPEKPEPYSSNNGIYIKNVPTGVKTPVITAADMQSATGSGVGVFQHYDVSFDGTKVVFDYKPSTTEGFRIWECNIDGTGLTQITTTPPDEAANIAEYYWDEWNTFNYHYDDMHPVYTPDDHIIFTSTRCKYRVLCSDGNLVSMALYRCDMDGSNLEKISASPIVEHAPSVMEDGRILYSCWEYVDKGINDISCIRAMQPDGTNTNEIFGLDQADPATVNYVRQIPGRPDLFVAATAPHEQANNIGSIILIDTNKDMRIHSNDPMTAAPSYSYVTPVRIPGSWYEEGWYFWSGSQWVASVDGTGGRLYTQPYPLDEETFLVSCKYNTSEACKDQDAYDIYMIDTAGNHQLVHSTSGTSCWLPKVLEARQRPMVINSFRNPTYAAANQAVCMVTDVYRGMQGVSPGAVKYLRVCVQIPRHWASDSIRLWGNGDPENVFTSVGWKTRIWPGAQVGIVPVESDGSAYFVVPADMAIWLQALDENYMEIQRERTFFSMRPGEFRSCVGCHERTGEAPPATDGTPPLALQSPPVIPGPMPGEAAGTGDWAGWGVHTVHYEGHIQPIWDNKCISCHDGSPDPDLRGTVTDHYRMSYEYASESLAGPPDTEPDVSPYCGPLIYEFALGMGEAEYLPPYSLGSGSGLAVLVNKLLNDPVHRARVTDVELNSIIRWVDMNAQYYGTYYGRHHGMYSSHPNFRVTPTFEEAISDVAPSWHN
jgi:hypothetical protein